MTASPFIDEWLARTLPAGTRHGTRALDLACGNGRHAILLARCGYQTFAVDVKLDAVRATMDAAAREQQRIIGWCADLTMHPLPVEAFDLVVVTRYLRRDLFPSLRASVRPGGCILYETFTVNQRALGTGPTSSDHLLEPGELRAMFDDWEIVVSEEVTEPEAVARIVARRPQLGV